VVCEKTGEVRAVAADLQRFKGKLGLARKGQSMLLDQSEGQKVTCDYDSQKEGQGAIENIFSPPSAEHWKRRPIHYGYANIIVWLNLVQEPVDVNQSFRNNISMERGPRPHFARSGDRIGSDLTPTRPLLVDTILTQFEYRNDLNS
jgi:hypothetical protein